MERWRTAQEKMRKMATQAQELQRDITMYEGSGKKHLNRSKEKTLF